MTTLTSVPSTTRSANPTTELHLQSVLESGLPSQLGTAQEPDVYTVPVVFSRQVTADERARIEAPETIRRLTAQVGAGLTGPDLRLVVSDRRLLIEGTTLDQLRDGLAGALADMLREIGRDLRSASSERAAAFAVRAAQEEQRAAAVHETVTTIRFE